MVPGPGVASVIRSRTSAEKSVQVSGGVKLRRAIWGANSYNPPKTNVAPENGGFQ